jgi:hypothetical protein
MIEFPDVFTWNPPHKTSPRVVFDLEKHFMFIISNYKITNINKTYVSGESSVHPRNLYQTCTPPGQTRPHNPTPKEQEKKTATRLLIPTSPAFLANYVC